MTKEGSATKEAVGRSGIWKLGAEQMKEQLAGYKTLSFWRSYRKLSASLIVGSAVLTIFVADLFNISAVEATATFLASLFLGIFVYLGHRWALITTMVLFTLDKFVVIAQGFIGPGVWIGPLIIWALFVIVFWRALLVENARRKRTAKDRLKKLLVEALQEAKGMEEEDNFEILGHRFSKEHFPVLYRWKLNNPDTLERQLEALAKEVYGGNVISAAQILESDLEHS